MRKLPRNLSVRPVKLQGELEETFYKKSDDGLRYRHSGNADLWLIETKDGTRGTLSLPRRGQGWMKDGATTWLTNSPREGSTMAKKKRRPPKGYKSWKAFMAKIRPNPKRKVSMKRKRVAKKSKAVARRRVVIVNPPKRRRHHAHRRNPNLGAMAKDAVMTVVNGAIGGAVMVATEVAARSIRSKALGMPAGSVKADATELGITTAAGLVANHLLPGKMGDRFGQLIVDAGFASVFRSRAKTLGIAFLTESLGDDGPRPYVVRGGRVVRRGAMAGYVAGPDRMNGYVGGRSRTPALGGYVAGAGGAEMAASYTAAGGGR